MNQAQPYRRIATEVAESLSQRDEVLAVWLFGGVQRGHVWDDSDVDLLVLTRRPPPLDVTGSLRDGVTVHLHWIGLDDWRAALQPTGNRFIQSIVGAGELLWARDAALAAQVEEVRAFPPPHRLHHLLPHLEALLRWAHDLRKRMALGDERPRRAAARQWEVDQHAASVLLIEKGLYPHNEPTTQALNARLFVPNLADPEQIEEFVRPRVEQWLLPRLREWAARGALDEAQLEQAYGVAPSFRLLAFAAREGWLARSLLADEALLLPRRVYHPA